MTHSTSILRSSPRRRYGMRTSANEDVDAVCGRGRAVPQRSLPPCGGGTGRGVERARRLLLVLFATLRARQASRPVFVATPLPVPPPPKGRSRPSSTGCGGREPWGTHLRISHSERVLR